MRAAQILVPRLTIRGRDGKRLGALEGTKKPWASGCSRPFADRQPFGIVSAGGLVLWRLPFRPRLTVGQRIPQPRLTQGKLTLGGSHAPVKPVATRLPGQPRLGRHKGVRSWPTVSADQILRPSTGNQRAGWKSHLPLCAYAGARKESPVSASARLKKLLYRTTTSGKDFKVKDSYLV